jgi:mRNA-degrading endonuclease toxin of MazEF toxin-antitoxin module
MKSRAGARFLRAITGLTLGTLVERLGRLSDQRMRELCDALEIAFACDTSAIPR